MTEPTYEELVELVAMLTRERRHREQYIQQLERLVFQLKAQRRDSDLEELENRLRFR